MAVWYDAPPAVTSDLEVDGDDLGVDKDEGDDEMVKVDRDEEPDNMWHCTSLDKTWLPSAMIEDDFWPLDDLIFIKTILSCGLDVTAVAPNSDVATTGREEDQSTTNSVGESVITDKTASLSLRRRLCR